MTDHNTIWTSLTILNFIKAKVKFISFEPLLGEIKTYPEIFQNYSPEKPVDYIARNLKESGINWVIIGAQTPVRKRTIPQISWIKEIVDAADRAGIPVFLKDNLHRLFEAEILKGDIMRHDGYLLPEWAGRITSDNRRVLRQELPREGR